MTDYEKYRQVWSHTIHNYYYGENRNSRDDDGKLYEHPEYFSFSYAEVSYSLEYAEAFDMIKKNYINPFRRILNGESYKEVANEAGVAKESVRANFIKLLFEVRKKIKSHQNKIQLRMDISESFWLEVSEYSKFDWSI